MQEITNGDMHAIIRAMILEDERAFFAACSRAFKGDAADLTAARHLIDKHKVAFMGFRLKIWRLDLGNQFGGGAIQFMKPRDWKDLLNRPTAKLVGFLRGIASDTIPSIIWGRSVQEYRPNTRDDLDQSITEIVNYFDRRTASDSSNPDSYHLCVSHEHHDGNRFVVFNVYSIAYR